MTLAAFFGGIVVGMIACTIIVALASSIEDKK